MRFAVFAAFIGAASSFFAAPAFADDDAPAPYAKFVDGLTAQKGLFTVWRKAGKVYLELASSQLDHDYILSAVPGNGLGGFGIYAGAGDYYSPHIVRFERRDDKVAIVYPNTDFVAPPASPELRAIEDNTARSVLGVAKIAAADDKTGSVVIDASAFLGDVIDLADALKATLGNPEPGKSYRLDADRSYFGPTKSFPQNTLVDVRQTWVSDDATIVDNVPDSRAIEFRVDYNFIEPPSNADYMPRLADDRVGYFDNTVLDFGSDRTSKRNVRYILRWNMQKSDPSKPVSPAKHPMVFYMTKTIPMRYRDAIRRGVLEWNKAFLAIGISDAVQVKDQPDDPNWDADDVRYSPLRWLTESNGGGFLEAQFYWDPRTGQQFRTGVIFDADYVQFGHLSYPYWASNAMPARAPFSTRERLYEREKHDNAAFGAVALQALGDWPGGDVPKSYIDDFLTDGTLHEIGHDMGLQHNFIGSQAYTMAQLRSRDFTLKHGIASSVMEYNPINLWPKGQSQGTLFMDVLGPYDFYVIHWGYAPVPGARTPQDELPTLRRWASQWTNPWYRFASDEDVDWASGHAVDPRVIQFDLSDDTLGWCAVQMKMDRSILDKLNARFPQLQHPFEDERTAFEFVLGEYLRCAYMTEHYIGGEYLSRSRPGDSGASAPLVPVARATERKAWETLDRSLFADDALAALHLAPATLNRLTYQEYAPLTNAAWAYNPPLRHDQPVVQNFGAIQNRVLNSLFSPLRLQRMDEIGVRAAAGSTMSLTDLFDWAQDSMYGDLRSRGLTSVPIAKRNLQYNYTRLLLRLAIAPPKGTPPDAQALARAKLVSLSGTLRAALGSGRLDTLTRAHLENLRAKVGQGLEGRTAESP